MAGKPRFVGPLRRYSLPGGFSTAFDPLDDLILHLSFLRFTGYTTDLLVSQHGIPKSDARKRALTIHPHADLAGSYLTQARLGPIEVSFVSAYYGILNLIKVCILARRRPSQLAANRWHGASYNPTAPLSRFLPSERITLHNQGAIPLFYEVVTGHNLAHKQQIRMGDIYPYISDVSAEWDIAAPMRGRRLLLSFDIEDRPLGRVAVWTIDAPPGHKPIPVKRLPALATFRRKHSSETSYELTDPLPKGTSDQEMFTAGIDRRYLWTPINDQTTIADTPRPLTLVEEFPILLAFFHLSNIARYNPEFLDRMRVSRYWPVVSAMRPHALF